MIRKAGKSDLEALAHLAVLLWEDNSVEDLAQEFALLIENENAVVYLKCIDNAMSADDSKCVSIYDMVVGFAQCQLRHDYVEGTETTPVGYLEGIYVKEGYRNQGYAGELLTACELWAKEMGCTEFASDCELDNAASLAFHKAMNFTEANRIICFTKAL